MEIVDSYIAVRLVKISKISIPVFYRNPKLIVSIPLDYSSRIVHEYYGNIMGYVDIAGVKKGGCVCKLFSEISGDFVSEVVTDEFGKFVFTNIDENLEYFVVIKEPSGNWEYRIRSRLKPYIE